MWEKNMSKYINGLRLYARKLLYRIEVMSPWVRYSKFARDRNYLKTEMRYRGYTAEDQYANIRAGSYFYHSKWASRGK